MVFIELVVEERPVVLDFDLLASLAQCDRPLAGCVFLGLGAKATPPVYEGLFQLVDPPLGDGLGRMSREEGEGERGRGRGRDRERGRGREEGGSLADLHCLEVVSDVHPVHLVRHLILRLQILYQTQGLHTHTHTHTHTLSLYKMQTMI